MVLFFLQSSTSTAPSLLLSANNFPSFQCKSKLPRHPTLFFPKSNSTSQRLTLKASPVSSPSITEFTDFEEDHQDEPDEKDLDSPWEGAVVYRRNASVAHVEYFTTLERLGLGNLSTDVSRSKASDMGIRIITRGRGAVDPLLAGGTPVLVSVDVARKNKKKLRMDGIVRTVITLGCNRCGGPAVKCIYSNFTLLLSEDPIEEPDEINLGTIFGDDKLKMTGSNSTDEDDDNDDRFIDLDDQLYFPASENKIDISKQVRDLLHVEITINAVCDVGCKGLCLKCGVNLNKSSCGCKTEVEGVGSSGPLGNLKKQMNQEKNVR